MFAPWVSYNSGKTPKKCLLRIPTKFRHLTNFDVVDKMIFWQFAWNSPFWLYFEISCIFAGYLQMLKFSWFSPWGSFSQVTRRRETPTEEGAGPAPGSVCQAVGIFSGIQNSEPCTGSFQVFWAFRQRFWEIGTAMIFAERGSFERDAKYIYITNHGFPLSENYDSIAGWVGL